ncbi:hypothetical protein Hanom_Chr04g00351111 [Helianthus anomalus]
MFQDDGSSSVTSTSAQSGMGSGSPYPWLKDPSSGYPSKSQISQKKKKKKPTKIHLNSPTNLFSFMGICCWILCSFFKLSR